MKASDIEKLINYVQNIDSVIAFKDSSNITQDDLDAIHQNLKKMRDIAVIDGEWIGVDDKLPEDGDNILCVYSIQTFKDGGYRSYQYAAKFEHGDFVDDEGLCADDVTHWMPLPKPPKVTHE